MTATEAITVGVTLVFLIMVAYLGYRLVKGSAK